MATVSGVIAFLEKFAPPELAENWDNVGLLIGRQSATVRKILTCLTLTPDVAAEAVSAGVQLVVSHHPVLFHGTKTVTDATSEGSMLLSLIENGVAAYSPHTSFDSAALGINQQLSKSFGLGDVQPIRPKPEMPGLGSGRWGKLPESALLSTFLSQVRGVVTAEYLEYSGDLRSSVSRVAVACGSAGEFLKDAIQLECDTFITGEAQFHGALEARTAGINLILLGHYSSERPAVEQLAETLSGEFVEAEVFVSQNERDPLSVFVS